MLYSPMVLVIYFPTLCLYMACAVSALGTALIVLGEVTNG